MYEKRILKSVGESKVRKGLDKRERTTLIILGFTILLWVATAVSIDTAIETVLLVLLLLVTVAFSFVSIAQIIVCLVKRFNENVSSYFLFGIINCVIDLLIAGYAVYDMFNSTGWFAGLTGFLILCFFVPIPVVLIIIDVIVYLVRKRRRAGGALR